MSRQDRFKLDPTIVKMTSDSIGANYGTAISKALIDVGEIANNNIKLEAQKIKNEYEAINLKNIRDGLEDDRTFANGILSDNPQEYFKNAKFNTSKYQLMGEDYKNSLSEKEKESHFKTALVHFSDDSGNLDLQSAKKHLLQKYKDGVIDEKMLYDLNDTLAQHTQTGRYTPKINQKEILENQLLEAKIRNINSETNKNYTSKINNQIGNDPLAKDKAKFEALKESGVIPNDMSFGTWLNENSQSVKAQFDNVSTAKNKLIDQNNGIEQILNVINQYNPKDFGVVDGMLQKGLEITGLHTERSARVQANMKALGAATAKAIGGSNPSNYEQKLSSDIIGGTFNSEAGAATKLKEAMNRGIIAQEETINRIRKSGADVTEDIARINQYKELLNDLKDWKGNTTIQEHLSRKNKEQNLKQNVNGIKMISEVPQEETQEQTQTQEQTTNNNHWSKYANWNISSK